MDIRASMEDDDYYMSDGNDDSIDSGNSFGTQDYGDEDTQTDDGDDDDDGGGVVFGNGNGNVRVTYGGTDIFPIVSSVSRVFARIHPESDTEDAPAIPPASATPAVPRPRRTLPVAVTELEALLRCPITHEPMSDPVMSPYGITYERTAILDWLKRSATDPCTRGHLSRAMLTRNNIVRDIMCLLEVPPPEERSIGGQHTCIDTR